MGVHFRDQIIHLDVIANLDARVKGAIRRSAQHALGPSIGDGVRHTAVRFGDAMPIDPTERVPAHRLDHGMAILACDEARPQTDDQRRGVEAERGCCRPGSG